MFLLKKIISSLIGLPGFFIIILLASGIYGIKKKIGTFWLNIVIGIILYLASTGPVACLLMNMVEKNGVFRGGIADAIILLGGGVISGADDLAGTHVPTPEMMTRIVDAVRLHKRYRLPVIVSGGSVFGGPEEAHVAKRFLEDLGVNEDKIILEDQSRDTAENAANVKKIFAEKGFKKAVLITSAFHMRRSMMIFRRHGIEAFPHSTGPLCPKGAKFHIITLFPDIHSLRITGMAIREVMGLLFYSF